MYKLINNKQFIFTRILILCLVFSQFMFTPVSAQVQDVFDSAEDTDVYLYKGDLISLKVYQLTRIAISNPGIVEIANADIDELLIVGQRVGETQLFIWDEYGKRQVFIRVLAADLDLIMKRIQTLLDSVGITTVNLHKNIFERKVVLTGSVFEQKADKFKDIISSPDIKSHILNYIDEDNDLIQIDVQVSELNTTLQKALGFNWNTGADGIILSYQETQPTFDGSVKDLFKIGDFERVTAIQTIVSALIAEGEARILSKPSIVVANGESANLLVGGEIPVRTTTTASGGSSVQENISYTSYGIDIDVTPDIKGSKIALELTTTIRDIDASNAVGEDVAFTTRTASTKLILNDGQTIVLAGLIKQNKAETVVGVPFLRRIPIIGFLFRDKNWPTDTEQEVVISLTPRIVTQKHMDYDSEEVRKKYSIMEEVYQENLAEEQKEALPPAEEEKEYPTEELSSEELDSISDEIDAILEEDLEKIEEEFDVQDFPEELTNQEMETIPPVMEEEQPEETEPAVEEEMPAGEEEYGEAVSEEEAMEMEEPMEMPEEMEVAETAEPAPEPAEAEEAVVDEGTSQIISEYVQVIQKKISRAISFPMEAKEQGWEGTVVLSLTILNDGTLNDAKIQSSSGFDSFDKDAINTARILAPFSSFPPDLDLEELVVTIPIVYSQEASLEGTEE